MLFLEGDESEVVAVRAGVAGPGAVVGGRRGVVGGGGIVGVEVNVVIVLGWC